jgi:hypothetical protein
MDGNDGLWSWLVFGVGGTKAAMGRQWTLCEPNMAELYFFLCLGILVSHQFF